MGCFCDRYQKEQQINTERNPNANETATGQTNETKRKLEVIPEKIETLEDQVRQVTDDIVNEQPTKLKAGAPAPANVKEEIPKEEAKGEDDKGRFSDEEAKEDEQEPKKFAPKEVEEDKGGRFGLQGGENDERFAGAQVDKEGRFGPQEEEQEDKRFDKPEQEDKRFDDAEQEDKGRFGPQDVEEDKEGRFGLQGGENDERFAGAQVDKYEEPKKLDDSKRFEDSRKEEEAPKLNSSKLSGKGSKGAKAEYTQEAFTLINQIRAHPQGFIQDIEKAKELIQTKDDKLIYAGKVKVALKEGEKAFDDAIEFLNNAKELPPLEMNEEITIPVPDNEDDIKNSKKLGELVDEKKNSGTTISSFFKDSVKDFYTSVLLLVVDDAGEGKKKKKRDAIFSKKYKKIGISNKKVGKTFGAYYTFA